MGCASGLYVPLGLDEVASKTGEVIEPMMSMPSKLYQRTKFMDEMPRKRLACRVARNGEARLLTCRDDNLLEDSSSVSNDMVMLWYQFNSTVTALRYLRALDRNSHALFFWRAEECSL